MGVPSHRHPFLRLFLPGGNCRRKSVKRVCFERYRSVSTLVSLPSTARHPPAPPASRESRTEPGLKYEGARLGNRE